MANPKFPDFRYPTIVLAWIERREGIRYMEIEDNYIEIITDGPYDEGDGYAATWGGYIIYPEDDNQSRIEAGTFGYGGTTPTEFIVNVRYGKFKEVTQRAIETEDAERFSAWVRYGCAYTITHNENSYHFKCVDGRYSGEGFELPDFKRG